MNKNTPGLIRVPGGLKRKLEEVIYKSPTILRGCPANHDVEVVIKIEYKLRLEKRPQLFLDTKIHRKRSPRGPKLVKSDEIFSDEYFESLLRSPFKSYVRDFILFFQKNGNKPMSPVEWMRQGFNYRSYKSQINYLCIHHGLNIRFLSTGEYRKEKKVPESNLLKYKFYVMEREWKYRA